jgi:photosystem II stability/assembly factor-like uncharacterized protein
VSRRQQEQEVAAQGLHSPERLRLSVARKYSTCREVMPRSLVTAFCLLLSAFCLLPSAYGSSWTRQRSGTMAWLHAVFFLDQNHGWVAGSGGTLLETTDGGQTWTKVRPSTTDTLRDVYFANDHDGWLVCERDVFKLKTNDEPRSYFLKTADGGLTWQRIVPEGVDANAKLVRAVFSGSLRGWTFGEGGVALFTSDGGASWSRQTLPTKYLLVGGTFVDEQHGWLVGAGATILQTSDGGTTWHSGTVRDGASTRFVATSFVGNRLGWAVGASGRVFATTDGGRTWFQQRTKVDADLLDVRFIDAAEGWIAGTGGTLLHTTDGGVHWLTESSGTTHGLERLFFTDQNNGWAVGFGGTILRLGQGGAPRLKTQ